MASTGRAKRKDQTRFRVGDRVRFHHVDRWLVGTVIEDRGPLAGGRQLLRVRARRRGVGVDDLITELPADELRVA